MQLNAALFDCRCIFWQTELCYGCTPKIRHRATNPKKVLFIVRQKCWPMPMLNFKKTNFSQICNKNLLTSASSGYSLFKIVLCEVNVKKNTWILGIHSDNTIKSSGEIRFQYKISSGNYWRKCSNGWVICPFYDCSKITVKGTGGF